MWNKLAQEVSDKKEFIDADGQPSTVKFLKMNCVDFGPVCQQVQIAAFPTLRLYKRDLNFEAFRQRRSPEAIVEFLEETIKKSHLMVSKHHYIFTEGCQISGSVEVPRVPGHFLLQAEAHGDEQVNPALTNVSHAVNHLSFGPQDQLV